jgi:hypothetical protein
VIPKLDDADKAGAQAFDDFFSGCMALAITFGNWWVYSQQAVGPAAEGGKLDESYDIHSPMCDLSLYQPPRYMVTAWLAATDANGLVSNAEPYHWSFYGKLDDLTFPSVQDGAFVARLGLARETRARQIAFQRMMNSDDHPHLGLFNGHADRPGTYVVYIKVPDARLGITFETLKPAVDTRVKIEYRASDETLRYKGTVIENVDDDNGGDSNHAWDYTVAVTGAQFDFKDDWHMIDVKMVDDRTAGLRAKAAIEELAYKAIRRNHGVDIKALIFQAPASIPEGKQGSFAERLTKDQLNSSSEAFGKIYKLNKVQKRAATELLRSESGITIIFGPPGTGKTYTQAAMIHEAVRHGSKVLFVCPSNKAVDAGLTILAKSRGTTRAIRFVGGSIQRKFAAGETDTRAWDQYFETTADVAGMQNSRRIYHTVKQEAFMAWSENESHELHAQAKEYLAVQKELQDHRGTQKERKSIISEMLDIENNLLKQFLCA